MREGRCAPPSLPASSAQPRRHGPARAPDLAGSGSRGERVQDLFHGLRTLGPRRQLGLDADAFRTDEARVAPAAHELDHLGAVERRVFHELQLHGLVGRVDRSEEHTELQSPMYLVCRLLLEKKKTNTK